MTVTSSIAAEPIIGTELEPHILPRALSAFDDHKFSSSDELLSRTQLSSISPIVSKTFQKISLSVSDTFLKERTTLILKKMELLIRSYDTSRFGNARIRKVLAERIDLGLSGMEGINRRWSVMIQKSDFHLIANELSLNDINRYQFHRNRLNGDDLPVFTPENQKLDR